MVRRVRKMSGGLKGKLAVALVAVALLSVAFCLMFWMFIKKNNSEKQYIARISELEELLVKSQEEHTDAEPGEKVTPKGENIRETECGFITISSNISDGDYADIRIRYIDGTDYVIASHKQIKAVNRDTGEVIIPVSEEELLLLDSAENDKKLYKGTKVYLTRYGSGDESCSTVNYTPTFNIKDLIENNPNVNEVSVKFNNEDRESLESKLSGFKGDYPDGGVLESEEVTEDYKGPTSGLPSEYGGSIWD